MHRRILGLIVGVGFLYVQSANASEMMRYEPSLYLTKSEVTDKAKKLVDTAKNKVMPENKVEKNKKKATEGTKTTKKAIVGKKHHANHAPHKHKHAKHHHKRHHHKYKRHMTKPGMERYIDKIAPEHD